MIKKKENKMIIELTKDNFKQTIKDGITLVEFYSPKCAPCKIQMSILEQLDKQLIEDTFVIAKCNIMENDDLVNEYGIKKLPTIMIFKNGDINTILFEITTAKNLLDYVSNAL